MIDIAALFNETTLRRCQDIILGNGYLRFQFLWCATVTLRPTSVALIYLSFFAEYRHKDRAKAASYSCAYGCGAAYCTVNAREEGHNKQQRY